MNYTDQLYIGLLAAGLVLAASILLHTIRRYGPSAVAVQPIFLFTVFFSMIHFVTPLLKFTQGPYAYQDHYEPPTLVLNAAVGILFLLMAWILSKSVQFSPFPSKVSEGKLTRPQAKFLILASVALYAIGAFFLFQDVTTIFNRIGYLEFMRDLHGASIHRNPLRILSNLTTLGSALLLAAVLSEKKLRRRNLFLFFILVIPVVFYAIILNSRNTLFLFSVINMTVFLAFTYRGNHFLRKPKGWKLRRDTVNKTLILMLTVFALYVAATQITKLRYGNFDYGYLVERRERIVFYALSGAFGNDENMLWLQEHSKNMELQYGWTYLAGVLNVVPRRFWPGKPHGAGPILINTIHPGSYVDGRAGNNSYTTGLVTEAYMNFGYLGVTLSVVAWAFLSSRAMRAFHRSSNAIYKTGFLLLAVLLSTGLLYSEFLGFFGRLFVLLVPVFSIGFLINIRVRSSPTIGMPQ